MTPVGRPEIGTPINVRIGDQLLADIDAHAHSLGVSRASLIRSYLAAALVDAADSPTNHPQLSESISKREAVKLLTGFTDEELTDLGGFDDDDDGDE